MVLASGDVRCDVSGSSCSAFRSLFLFHEACCCCCCFFLSAMQTRSEYALGAGLACPLISRSPAEFFFSWMERLFVGSILCEYVCVCVSVCFRMYFEIIPCERYLIVNGILHGCCDPCIHEWAASALKAHFIFDFRPEFNFNPIRKPSIGRKCRFHTIPRFYEKK